MTSEPGDKPSLRTTARRPRRRRIVLMLVLVGAAAALVACRCYPTETPPRELPTSAPASAPASDEDARLRKLVLGTWSDNYKGKRTMTLLEDGTGTMLVELSGFNAVLGSRLRFDMVWSVEAGRLKKRTTGGEPSISVSIILEAKGDRVDEPILELTEQRLLLRDADGETEYDWRRVE